MHGSALYEVYIIEKFIGTEKVDTCGWKLLHNSWLKCF